DNSERLPLDTTRLTWGRAMGNWFTDLFVANGADDRSSTIEHRLQQRAVTSVAFEGDASFKSYTHSDSDADVKKFFDGTGISTLVSPETSAFNRNAKFRFKRSPKWADLYVLTELHAAVSKQGKEV